MTEAQPEAREPARGRLIGWIVLVAALASLSYAARLSETDGPPKDVLYRWSTAVGGAVQYLAMAAIALAIARGLARDLVGLRRPASWWRAAGVVLGALVAIWIAGALLGLFLNAGREQGLVPSSWDPSRAAPFAANFAVVAVAAPLVEELIYRGLGYGLLVSVTGPWLAIGLSALAFGLAHGLVVALPVLTLFGAILGWVRWRTASLYPAMILHGIFNAAALVAAITTAAM